MGSNAYGQLGISTKAQFTNSATKLTLSNIIQISAGWSHSAALSSNVLIR